MVNASKAKIAANRRYNEKNFDVVQCRVKKSENINQRIDDAIRGTDTSKAAFILDAIRAKLDGVQGGNTPVQAQPEPPVTPDPNTITVQLDAQTLKNMDGAIGCNYSTGRAEYITRAVNEQLRRDIETEKAKRRAARATPPPDV